MSKLSNMIEAHQTGRVKLSQASPVVTVTESLSEPIMNTAPHAMREYRIGVKLAVNGYVDDDHAKDVGLQLVYLKDMCKRQIINEVFGEFRPLLRAVERHLYAHNFKDARTALLNLENEMMS